MCPRPFLNGYRCKKRLKPLSTFPETYQLRRIRAFAATCFHLRGCPPSLKLRWVTRRFGGQAAGSWVQATLYAIVAHRGGSSLGPAAAAGLGPTGFGVRRRVRYVQKCTYVLISAQRRGYHAEHGVWRKWLIWCACRC